MSDGVCISERQLVDSILTRVQTRVRVSDILARGFSQSSLSLHSNIIAQVIQKPSRLTPISHNEVNGSYKVVIMKTVEDPEQTYTMFVGEGYVRVYSEQTLLTDLRIRLSAIDQYIEGMVVNEDSHVWVIDSPRYDYAITIVYENRLSPDMNEIGWRYRNLYCVILTEEELKSYRGVTDGNT